MTVLRLLACLLAVVIGIDRANGQDRPLRPETIESRLDALEERMGAVRSGLEALSARAAATETTAVEAQRDINALSTLSARIVAQDESLAVLNDVVQADQVLLTEQREQLNALALQVRTLAAALDGGDMAAPVDSEMVAALEGRLAALEASLQDQPPPDAVALDRVSALSDAVAQLRAADAALGERLSAIPAIEAETDALESRLDALLNGEALQAAAATPESVDLVNRKVEALSQSLDTLTAAAETDRQTDADQTTRLEIETARVESLVLRIDSLAEQQRAQEEAIENHEGRIEDNSLKLYELLIEVESMIERLEEVARAATRVQRRSGIASGDDGEQALDQNTLESLEAIRTGLALALTLIGPFGLIMMNARPERTAQEAAADGAGVALAWAGGMTGFVLLGGGLLLGPSLGGVVGNPSAYFVSLAITQLIDIDPLALRMIAAHAGLAGLAGLVACSGVVGLTLLQRLIVAAVFGALVYPLAAHWLRDTQTALGGVQGWAATRGFLDPGGTAGLAAVSGLGAIFLRRALGPRPSSPPLATPPMGETFGALMLWVAWLGAALVTPEPLSSPVHTALAVAAGTAGGCVMLAALGMIFAMDERWLHRLAAAGLAGGIAGPAASIGAPLLHCLLIGALAAALFVALTEARADPDGRTVPACAIAAGGLAATLAPALIGPVGLITRGTFEAFSSQGFGLIAFIALSLVAGYGCARLVKAIARTGEQRA